MELAYLKVSMTKAMFEDTKRLADESRIPHGEWVRRCMCWGTQNPEFVRRNRCREEYKVSPRGRPGDEY